MWILHFFKETLNSSFDYFIQKVKGRFLAFAIQLIVSYLAVALFTLMITLVMVSLMNQGNFSINLFSFTGLYEWIRMIDPVWMVTDVIAVNFLFVSGLSKERMSFPDFYKKRSSGFWLDLLIAVSILAVVLTIYYKNELLLTNGASPIDLLLHAGFKNELNPLANLLSSWIYYTIISLPVIAIILIEVRERKRNRFKLKLSFWKILLGTLLLSFIISWTFESLLYMFGELVMNLIYAPFELIEIPAIFGVIVSILFKTLNFITLATIVHFGIRYGMEENDVSPVNTITKDILDD